RYSRQSAWVSSATGERIRRRAAVSSGTRTHRARNPRAARVPSQAPTAAAPATIGHWPACAAANAIPANARVRTRKSAPRARRCCGAATQVNLAALVRGALLLPLLDVPHVGALPVLQRLLLGPLERRPLVLPFLVRLIGHAGGV